MSILNTILNSQNGAPVSALGRRFGLDENQTQAALKHLVPALNAGVKRNVQQQDGLSALLGALGNGNHDRYLEQPDLLERDETVSDGNGILGHIFGSKDVSRQVAAQASQQTGIDSGILKKMLPLVATMAMGSLKKQSQGMGFTGQAAPASNSGGLLTQLLDADGDGSIGDDIWNMAKKLF